MTISPFASPITGGDILVQPAIQSPDFVTGVSGWDIKADGSAEFNDIELHGSVIIDNPLNGLFIYAS